MACPDIRIEPKTEGAIPDAAPVLGQRSTRQRKLIFDILSSSDDHMDVETLYRKARDIDARVSLSTVYRTVSLLKEANLIDELVFEDERRCYEYRKPAGHHHVRCMSCGEIIEFASNCSEKLKMNLEAVLGYQVDTVRIDVSGYCKNCSKH